MQPDRVDPPRSDSPRAAPRKRFEELLPARAGRPGRKAPPPPRPQKTATPARAPRSDGRAARVPGELRGQARREMDAAARQRLADGQAAGAEATGRLQTRTAELLCAALRTEEAARAKHGVRLSSATPEAVASDMREPQPTGVSASPGIAGTTASAPTSTEGRVERVLALVERIERFVRSG